MTGFKLHPGASGGGKLLWRLGWPRRTPTLRPPPARRKSRASKKWSSPRPAKPTPSTRVPLSIAAVTQQNLDQQGIKQVSDITRLVPGLNVAAGATTPACPPSRSAASSAASGSATTGIYLDDTNLAKRANNGVNQNNGAPTPLLFDLERVEVLKGPARHPVRRFVGRRHGPLHHPEPEPDHLFRPAAPRRPQGEAG